MKANQSVKKEKQSIGYSFLEAFSNIAKNITNKKGLDFILKSILLNSSRFMGTKHGCILLLNPEQDHFDIRLGLGDFRRLVGMKCNSEARLVEKILKVSKTIVLNETCKWNSKDNKIEHQNLGKMVAIPINTEERSIGFIILSFPIKDWVFQEKLLPYINAFSSLALIALDNARLYNFIHDEYHDLVKAEKSLRQSEDKFYKLFELSPNFIAIISIQNHTLLDVNENLLKILKFKKSDIIGKRMENFVSLKPDMKAQVIELVKSRKIVRNGDIRITASTGEEKIGFLSNQIININDEDCMVFSITDITEIANLREELDKARSFESLAILSAGIAHNFNNLLQSLLGNISLAKYYLKPEDEVFKILTRAEKSYSKTKELTDQLITFSNSGMFRKIKVEIREFIHKLIEELNLPENIELKLDIQNNIQELDGDERQLIHCFKNIITNSVEAIKGKGSIEIKMSLKNIKTPEAAGTMHNRVVEFIIRDNGGGIKKEDMRKVLTPFFSTKGTTHKGLGLAISYSIIHRHDGKIKIESQYGVGTTVKIHMPVVES